MLISTFLVLAALGFLAFGMLWSIFMRRLHKTRLRFFCVLGSLVLTIIVTIILRNTLLSQANVLPWLEAKVGPDLMLLLEASPTLCEVALGSVAGLIAPLLFLLVFIILNFISWIVYLLLTLVFGGLMKERENPPAFAMGRTIILAAAQTLIILVVWLVPITAYAGVAPVVLEALSESETLPEEAQAGVDAALDQYVRPLNSNAVIGTFRVLGGQALTNTLTDFTVAGEKIHITDELGTLTKLTCDVMCLTQSDFANYDTKQEEAILGIADRFGESAILPVIGGEFVYGATDAWLNDSPFLGLYNDFVYIDDTGMFDEFITCLLEILHADSAKGNEEALCTDLSTTANLLVVFIRGGVFESLGDMDAMVGMLSAKGLVNNIITILGENPSMKVLIPEITNIGVRSIASTLGVKEDVASVYDDMMNAIADGLNAAQGKTGEEQIQAVTESLVKSFDEAGMPVDAQILDSYSASMIESFLSENQGAAITPEDVKGFFAVYAWSTEIEGQMTESKNPDATTPLAGENTSDGWKEALIGTIFEGMDDEALKKSGPAILARVNLKLSEIDQGTDEATASEIRRAAEAIVREEYGDRLNESAQKAMLNVTATVVLDKKSIEATVSMKAPAAMAEVTRVITLERLLLDAQKAAEMITPETIANEAAAIEAVFSAAQTLISQTSGDASNLDLNTVATSVGTILNEMSGASFFGEDKAKELFTAVIQSPTVRETADIDMSTATQLANKGSEGNVDYEKTFGAISQTVTVMENMNKNDGQINDEDIEELIRNINPQTAGMLEVYVTAERLEQKYQVPGKYAGTAAPLLSNMFHYMADAEMSDDEYRRESTAINNMMTLTMAARDNAKDSEHNRTLFGADGILGKEAYDALCDLMASKSLAYSLRTTPYENDPFELSELMTKSEGKDERAELEDAIRTYYAQHNDEETYRTLELIAKLFGIENLNEILSV